NAKSIAVVKQPRSRFAAESVLPVRTALGGDTERGAGTSSQLAAAGDEIGVNVSLRYRCDAQALGAGSIKIALDVAIRIDDHGLAGAAQQKAGLRKLILVKTRQNHVEFLLLLRSGARESYVCADCSHRRDVFPFLFLMLFLL